MTAAICRAVIMLWSAEVPADRCEPAVAALIAEARGEDPVLLVALAIEESRLDPWAVGAIGDCGLLQAVWSSDRAVQDRRCRRILGNYTLTARAGVQKLADAREFCSRRAYRHLPSEACALAGFAAGPRGVRALAAGERWPAKTREPVLRRAKAIRRAMAASGGAS